MNLYEYTRPVAGSERVDILLKQRGVRIERIVSNSADTGWFDQEEDEWIALIEGKATLQVEEQSVALERGDVLLLRAHVRHRVVSTSEDALWLTVFVDNDADR